MTNSIQQGIDTLRAAITDVGPCPEYHKLITRRHRQEWPVLWRAIDQILDGSAADYPIRAISSMLEWCNEEVIPSGVREILHRERHCTFPRGHLGEHGPLRKSHAIHSAERRDDLLRMWRCGDARHDNCWASSHVPGEKILLEATYGCTEACTCWRHAIAAHVTNESPPVPEFKFDWRI